MWKRWELKERARQIIRGNYWQTVLVSLIFLSISNGRFVIFSGRSAHTTYPQSYIFYAIGMAAATIMPLIFLGISFFIFSPLKIGVYRFFVKNQKEKASASLLTFGFSNSYFNIVWVMFLMSLKTFLWSMLFLIPGIIKSYEYMMIPYILAENPDLNSKEAFARSRAMMDGEKWNAFVMSLSFFGWIFLGAVTGGIVMIFYTTPYRNAAFAELYTVLKQKINR